MVNIDRLLDRIQNQLVANLWECLWGLGLLRWEEPPQMWTASFHEHAILTYNVRKDALSKTFESLSKFSKICPNLSEMEMLLSAFSDPVWIAHQGF